MSPQMMMLHPHHLLSPTSFPHPYTFVITLISVTMSILTIIFLVEEGLCSWAWNLEVATLFIRKAFVFFILFI
jgi:hypothetical protein